jgi:hypothetical protein
MDRTSTFAVSEHDRLTHCAVPGGYRGDLPAWVWLPDRCPADRALVALRGGVPVAVTVARLLTIYFPGGDVGKRG